jgi:NADPH:quinone reductase-like Zn-dependent oxidoreductase
MKYNSILVTQHGEPETIQIIENELRTPAPGEVCIRILASPVCQDDVAVRVGNRPFLPKLPFIPGYSIVGEVTAIGEGVSKVAVKDHAAALTNFGGHAEYIYSKAEQLMPVPANLDPAEAVVLILNYLVAYQVLHRVARVKTGDKVLLIGASGGVGTAFLQLGKLAGLKMYGLASPSKHKILSEYRTIPIDYHTQDFVKVIKQAEPEGLDYVFNGMGEEYLGRGRSVLRRGGMLVHYGAPQSLLKFGSFLARFVFYSFFSNGKKMEGYGTHRLGVELFKEDWTVLFKLLEEGQIKPIISAKFPILEAAQGYRLLESGQVAGNIVLLSPDLM